MTTKRTRLRGRIAYKVKPDDERLLRTAADLAQLPSANAYARQQALINARRDVEAAARRRRNV